MKQEKYSKANGTARSAEAMDDRRVFNATR